jgi:hypothetical protein
VSSSYLITREAVVDSKVSASVEAVSVRDQLWKSKQRMSGKKGEGEDCGLAGVLKILPNRFVDCALHPALAYCGTGF